MSPPSATAALSSKAMPEAPVDPDHLARLVSQIAAAKVLDMDGQPTRIRDLWRDRVTVTSFVRHFGCLFCHQMVHELVAGVPEILRSGGRVVIVGNGTVEQAKYFFSMKQLPRAGVAVVTDPDRESFKAAGFERGIARTALHPGALKAFATTRAEGFKNTGLFGDLTQLGGLLVVKHPASLLYFHKSRFAGDHPKMNDVIEAIRSA
jgi:hypothetical protein